MSNYANHSAIDIHVLNQPCEGETVKFPNGEVWTIKNDTTGWELRRDPKNWRTTHPTLRGYMGMVEFCGAINDIAREQLHELFPPPTVERVMRCKQ